MQNFHNFLGTMLKKVWKKHTKKHTKITPFGACTIVGAEKVVLNFHTFFHTFSWYYVEKGVEKAHQKPHQKPHPFRDGTPIKKLQFAL